MATPADVIALATKYAKDNYREGARNATLFGKWYGLPNDPWCAMFVSYIFNKAGAGKLIGPAKKGFASCVTGLTWLKEHATPVAKSKAQAGDIVFFNWDGGSVDHVGIVISNNPKAGTMKTVEGNTSSGNQGSQNNGEGVYIRTRYYGSVAAVIRPHWEKVAPKPAAPEAPATPAKPAAPEAPATPAKPAAPEAPAKPTTEYHTVTRGESYWAIAIKTLGVKNTPRYYAKIALESKRIQKLNKGKGLNPGDKIRVK